MVFGDINAQLKTEHYINKVAGKHPYHEETEDNGMRLSNFAEITLVSTDLNIKLNTK